jgi:hypothetical protein
MRTQKEHTFRWASGATDSNTIDLSEGYFGTVIVPSGSALIGKTLQFVAVSNGSSGHAEAALLTTPITLAAGANPISASNSAEIGPVGWCKLRVNTSVGSASTCALLWKS